MTPGDEAGALKEESAAKSPADSAKQAHDDPAPAEADPGAEEVKEAPAPAKAEAEDKAEAPAKAEEPAGTSTASFDAGQGRPASAGAWAVSVAVLVVLLIVGLWTAGMYWQKSNAASATSSDKQAAMNTAKTAVTDLFTINYQHPGDFAAKLKPIAAGNFLSVVNNASAGFGKLMQEGKVQTAGKVQLMGVQKYGGTTAQVAVLAYETVKNSDSPQGSEHPFRMSLSLIKSGSKWLVSNLEFVR